MTGQPNKRREDLEKITSDARILKRELESYGFTVELMNEDNLQYTTGSNLSFYCSCLVSEVMH